MGADFYNVLHMIHDRLKCNAVPIQLPIGSEDTFKGIIDLVEMDADIYYDEMGKDMRVEGIPADMMELAQEYRTKLIDACADLLMFLTAPEQNNRMIGDLKGGMPLNPSEDFELADHLKPLNDVYWQDVEKLSSGERVNWAALCSWEVLGYNFNTTFIRNMEDVQWGGKSAETATVTLANAIKNTINTYMYTEGWDTSAW